MIARSADVGNAAGFTSFSDCVFLYPDDGVGFDVAAVRQADISVGMRSMLVRIARVGGTLGVRSEPGRTVPTTRLMLPPP